MSLSLQDYWKDDFIPLKDAGKAITRSLRDDEADPSADLFRKVTSGAHVYTRGIPRVRHVRSSSLPEKVIESREKVRVSSIMGILEQGGLAYCAVDSTLFLWKVNADLDDNNLMHYVSPSLVLSVGLVRPKIGVFKTYVEWCLVVNTQDQVILIAVANRGGALELVTTYYTLSNDGVRVLAVAGTNDGRIFLGGEDSTVYEMKYEGLVKRELTVDDQLELFYDADETVPSVLKGSLRSGLSSRKRSSTDAGFEMALKSFKCQKVACGSASVARNFVPDGLLKVASALVPAVLKSPSRGAIQQIVVDEERKTLYALSRKGWICSYDISRDVLVKGVMEGAKVARSYLEDAAHARYTPRNTSYGFVVFPGGSSSAQAGLGGPNQAQALKRYVDQRSDESFLTPVSIHLVPPSESATITLVATTLGGLRLYITALPVQHTASVSGDLRPSSRLTLCYMRALPPTGMKWQEMASTRIMESVHAHADPKKQVSASMYRDGLFVVAVDGDKSSSILAMCSDLAKRQTEDLEGQNNRRYKAPGGVTEAASEPLSAPISGGHILSLATLPLSYHSQQVIDLTIYSETPSDGYISGDIPSPFVPPHRQVPNSNALAVRNGESGTISTFSAILGAMAQAIGGSMRPFKPFSRSVSNSSSNGTSYRISKRDNTRGFSKSALEYSSYRVSMSSTSSTPTSSRLNRRLLSPSAAPLSDAALSHIAPDVKFVAMNSYGVHFFVKTTLLRELSGVLEAAGDNIVNDPDVRLFFEQFGAKESCALCFGLAVNSAYSDLICGRAVAAAFMHGYTPRLIQDDQNRDVAGVLSSDDSLVPERYCFFPSPLYQGLLKLTCRLLRPILHKPCVVVTEGRVIESALSTGKKITPAKVELLLDQDELESILSPLCQLRTLIKEHFTRAVESVPGTFRQTTSLPMDIDEDENAYIPALRNRAGLQEGINATQLSLEDARTRAHLIEEKNIHLLYRYISRSIQALDLFRILQRYHSTPDAPIVEWGKLHGLTVANLVQEVEAQDRVESLLNSLVTFGNNTPNVLSSVDLDGLSQELAMKCNFFFSPGSRHAYLGIRKAEEAQRRGHHTSAMRSQIIDEAVGHFRDAARFWQSATLVTGLIMKSRVEESISQIASRARDKGSPLVRAADALMKLGDAVAVVDICLITASNFRPQQTLGIEPDAGLPASLDRQSMSWERELYHRRLAFVGTNGVSSPSSSSSALGTSVTADDAAKTCYAIVLDHLGHLAEAKNPLVDTMVARCAESNDNQFLTTFFHFLLDKNFEEILLRINAREVELWLISRSNPELLGRYYRRQDRFVEAACVFDELAHAEAEQLYKVWSKDKSLLNRRIHLLTQARNAYADAAEQDETLRGKFGDVSLGLTTALLQQRVLHILQGSPDVTNDELSTLASTLVSPSDLLNDYCAKYRLYDFCLLILNVGGYREMEHIQRFWRLLIETMIVPCYTDNETAYTMLQDLFGDDGERDDISLGRSPVGFKHFDSGEWIVNLERKIVCLGRELQNSVEDTGISPVPVKYLLQFLEYLASACSHIPAVWPLKVIVDIGIPYWTVLKFYEEGFLQERDNSLRERLRRIGASLELMRLWTFSPASSSGRQELLEAVQSSRFFGRLSQTRNSLGQLAEEATATNGDDQWLVHIQNLQSLVQELSDRDPIVM